jgi:hypothetical protein
METKRTRGSAGELGRAKRSFEQWRRSRGRREPIPERLWRMAVEAAAVGGVYATARRLRLNPTRLKGRMQAAGQGQAWEEGPRFVELPFVGAPPLPECILEAEDQSGTKLRIHLKGGATAQAVSLGRMLWREEG